MSPHASPSRIASGEYALAIYMAITLLGIIAAASWKNLFADYAELVVLIIGGTITVTVAHAWATVSAHRLAHQRALTSSERREELRGSCALLAVGLFAIVTLTVSHTVTDSLAESVLLTLLVLVAVLFAVGVVGARLSGKGWWRSLGWGLIDASIGIAVLVVKVVFGS